MKKIISIILSVVLVFSVSVTGFAYDITDVKVQTEYPLVVVRGMEFNGMYVDLGLETEHNAVHPITFTGVASAVLKGLYGTITQGTFDAFFPPVVEYVNEILGELACDKNGESVYNTTKRSFPLSVDNYPELLEQCKGYPYSEYGFILGAAERYGGENVYYFDYDWRYSPLETTVALNTLVEQAKADHNTDKVNLICSSMGGVVGNAYIYQYGYESLNKCIFNSSTFCGTYVVTDLFQGKVEVSGTALEYFLYDSMGDNNFFVNILGKLGVFDAVAEFAMKIVEDQKDYVYDELLIDTFVTMPGLWGIVLPDEYEACIEYLFPTEELKEEYSVIIEKSEALYEMNAQSDEMLLEMAESGVEVAVFAGYNSAPVPVYERAVTHGDNVLESSLMLGRANVANLGETLGDDYVPETEGCLSPDRMVDLSTVLFPESTWAFRDMVHVSCAYGSDVADFAFWLLEYEGQPTVNSNPEYPRFMISSQEENLIAFE